MAPERELQRTNFMKKILFGVYMSVACTLAWSQSSRSLPPMPPPPNPASVGNVGSPAFYMLQNNIKSAQSSEPIKNSLTLESIEEDLISGPGNTKGKKPSVAYDSQPRSLQMPESFESNIQGLQFIQKLPSQ